MGLNFTDLKEFLDEKADQYNHPRFIDSDPVQVPHRYSKKEDIEIAGFLTAVISWGNRKSIINNAFRMMKLLGNSPYDFILNHKEKHLGKIDGLVHRTFTSADLMVFITALKSIYIDHNGLEGVFAKYKTSESLQPAIHEFKNIFFSVPHLIRTRKHLPDPNKGSAAKKINLFLRWMVRKDNRGVDFGIWDTISPSILSCPLDVHTGNIARKLGLLERKQNDAKTVNELDTVLRLLDKNDPVRYDYALFGIGALESE